MFTILILSLTMRKASGLVLLSLCPYEVLFAISDLRFETDCRSDLQFCLQIDTDTLACTYACLILHDDGLNIDAGSIMKLIKAANCEVESFWPSMFAKALQTSDINDLMMKGKFLSSIHHARMRRFMFCSEMHDFT